VVKDPLGVFHRPRYSTGLHPRRP